MVASTTPNGDAGHGRQDSGSALANRASRTITTDRAHGGISTESTETARRASGGAHNARRSRDNNDNDEVNPRPSSRPRHAAGPCCDCTRHSTCTTKQSASKAGCACRSANRRCVSCACFGKCRNKVAVINESTGIFQNFFNSAVTTFTGAADPTPTETDQTNLLAESGNSNSLVAASTTAALTTVGAAAAPAAATESTPLTQPTTPLCARGYSNSRSVNPGPANGTPAEGPANRQNRDPTGATADNLPPEPTDVPRPPPAANAPMASTLEEGADLPGYESTPADQLLDSVYGDHPHNNDGRHLDGGIIDDQKWQSLWLRVTQLAPTRYAVPKGKVGKRFLVTLTNEFRGARERRWNSERPLVFAATILQSTTGVRRSKDIRRRLARRMDLWDQGCFVALVDDTEVEIRGRIRSNRTPDDEALARSFNAKVLSGRLRAATRNLTNRDGGEVLKPDDTCTKTGRPVVEVLHSKHPELREPPSVGSATGAFEPYGNTPQPIPVDITAEDVEAVATRLTGAAGPGGTDAVDLRNWLLRFGKESEALREEMALWASWLANGNPPWAAYRALMAARLVALDKQPGVRPVGIGEIYRRLFAKCLLKVIGSQATAACGNYNLCAGLPAGIEGAVHAVREVFEEQEAAEQEATGAFLTQPATDEDDEEATGLSENDSDEEQMPGLIPRGRPASVNGVEPTGVLQIDAKNGFNELSRKAMLWTARHRWANGARFSLNCYRHASMLILRRQGGSCEVLLSREGVTQGDPLSMVLYGLALTPLAEQLRLAVPTVVQPWYADDAAMEGPVRDIAKAMRLLQQQGPARGYYPEPTKSIFVGHEGSLDRAKILLMEFDFQYRDGSRYVGGFIGDSASQAEWVDPQIEKWIDGVKSLAKVARKFPQTAYAGLVQSLQGEWQYLQRVTPGTEDAFAPLEEAIAQIFLPALLEEPAENIAPLRSLLALSPRQAGLGVPSPRVTAESSYQSSVKSTGHLANSLKTGAPLDATDYAAVASQNRRECRKARVKAEVAVLEGLCAGLRPAAARRLRRSRETGTWITATPDKLNGTELSAEEFRDSLRLRFGLLPSFLPQRCDGCNERFTVEHAMSCKKGGLVLQRHDDVAAEWHHLCAQALTPSAVSDEPLIHTGRGIPNANEQGVEAAADSRGDVAAHGFWRRGTTAIFDVRITDTDAPSNRAQDPTKVLKRHEKEKKKKYLAPCVARRRHFTPLVFSVDGLQGPEASAASKCLASKLSKKWGRSYSEVVGYVRSRLSIALVRAASRCLRVDRSPSLRAPTVPWESGSGLGLYR
jgi:hypothetical protein